jgi:SIS domain
MAQHIEEIRRQLAESVRVKQSFSDELVARIAQFAEKSAASLRSGGKIVFFGNGGSASDALHLSAELVVRLRTDRPGLASLALTSNPSVLTAAGNDYGFEKIFSRQIESLVSKRFLPAAQVRIFCAAWKLAALAAPTSSASQEKPAARLPPKWISSSTCRRKTHSAFRNVTSRSATSRAR